MRKLEGRQVDGFTLTELLVTVAVAAILAGLAAPAFNDFIKNERISAEANDIVTSLHLARTEALKRNRRVTICPSIDADTDVPSCSGSNTGDWTSGYIIFTDGNRTTGAAADGVFEPNAPDNEVLVKAKGPLVGQLQLGTVGAVLTSYLSFLPRGHPRTLPAGSLTPSGEPTQPQTGLLRLCDDRGDDDMRVIVISRTGRVRVLAGSEATARTSCPP